MGIRRAAIRCELFTYPSDSGSSCGGQVARELTASGRKCLRDQSCRHTPHPVRNALVNGASSAEKDRSLGTLNSVTCVLRSHAELRAVVILLSRALARNPVNERAKMLLLKAESVLRIARRDATLAAEQRDSRDTLRLDAIESMLDTPGSDLLIDRLDDCTFTITSSEDAEGQSLREAVDELIRTTGSLTDCSKLPE